jgi:hypothetical protein
VISGGHFRGGPLRRQPGRPIFVVRTELEMVAREAPQSFLSSGFGPESDVASGGVWGGEGQPTMRPFRFSSSSGIEIQPTWSMSGR